MPQNQSQKTQQKNDLKQLNKPKNQSGEFTPEIHPLLRLQNQIGNAKVARMVADDNQMQRLPEVGKAGGPVSNQLASRITSQLGKGSPLPAHRREQMESHFMQPLEDVRLHTGEEANNLNQSISASAFTLGSDVFFGNKVSPNDDHLLTHELTHVVQQRSMPLGGPLTVGPSDDQFEQQAQSTAGNTKAMGNSESFQNLLEKME